MGVWVIRRDAVHYSGAGRLPAALAVLTFAALALVPQTHAAPSADPWPFWEESNEGNTRSVDHSNWQRLLDDYLITTDDGRTLFRYKSVHGRDREKLDSYVTTLADTDPRTLSRDEQLAYWINLYNALTVRVVLDHPDEDSIRSMGGGWFSSGPWDEDLVTIAGQDVTLNDIEHRILRPIWNDHHIHYAVNCASVSCPLLATEAYTRDNAQRLMEAGETHYLHHPLGLELHEDEGLRLSSIYDWYVEDFGGTREALLEYLAGERPDLAERLRSYRGEIRYHYDWSLNDAD